MDSKTRYGTQYGSRGVYKHSGDKLWDVGGRNMLLGVAIAIDYPLPHFHIDMESHLTKAEIWNSIIAET